MRNRFSNTTKTWLLVIFAVVAILYAVLPYAGHKEKGIVDLLAENIIFTFCRFTVYALIPGISL